MSGTTVGTSESADTDARALERVDDSECCGALLAGGQSRRMGRDKALLPLFGAPMIESPARVLRGVFEEWAVFGGDPESLAFLNRPVIPDAKGGQGPLDGIAAALRYYAPRPVLVVACDLPFVQQEHLRWLLGEAAATPGSIVVASEDGTVQPLCGVYNGSALEAVEEALKDERRSVMRLIESLDARVLEYDPPASESRARPPEGWLSNVNSPADYDRADRRGQPEQPAARGSLADHEVPR